ncbi:unnamed protein product [Ilex paraguariensis]|uniref:Cytochrome P450 n=1 Tax=Ilex paraguariensis TaxID=185542 RepID=A0ABC8SC87_9AQUA
MKEPLHQTLQHLSYKHGPIFSLQLGTRFVVVLSSPSTVQECFTNNDVIFANRPRLLVGKHLNYDYTTIGAAPYGHLWRNLRRFTTLEIFSTTRLNMYLSIRQAEIKLLLKSLYQASGENCVKVEMKSRLSELAFNIIMRMVAGKRYFGVDVKDYEEARLFRDIIREIFDLSGASNPGDFLPILQWIDYQGLEKRMLKLRRKADVFLQGLIDEHQNKQGLSYSQEGRTNTMIDNMLSLQDSEPEFYSDDIIKGIILILLTAGTDTSAVTIEWAMSLLLNHPDVLKKARFELDNYASQDRLIDEPDLSKLPYLQSIVNETLRMFPPVPLLSPHESSADSTIGGYFIPRNTMLLVNAWAIHKDPQVWGDPQNFRPERFEDEDGEGEAHMLIPFGLGRRSCPGAGLANRVVGLALGALIQCFEWERVSEELEDMSEGTGLIMPKAKPLETMCRARERMISVLAGL